MRVSNIVRMEAAAGFTLIEVLVAVLVLALGIIGAAGMQLTALRTTQQSSFQTAAVQLASEIADKMRANDLLMKQADGDNPFLSIDYAAAADPAAPPKLCYGSGNACSAAELASFDIYEWEKRLKAALPSARAVVCRDATPWDAGAGRFKWECDGAGGGQASLVVKIGWRARNPDGSAIVTDAANHFAPGVVLTAEPYVK